MKNSIKKAKKFAKKVSKKGIPVREVILFGSHSKKDTNKDSDIDICIVSSKFGKDYIKDMATLRKISLEIDSRIEPIPFGINDLDDPYSTLSSEIRNTGIYLQ